MTSIRTRFILIETSHAGNVGATARAMKTMGFDDLVLVRPRWSNVLRRKECIERSSGALDVLEKARIVQHLDEALDGMHHLCATVMTARDFGAPTFTPRQHFKQLIKQEEEDFGLALLFGCERFGMSNADVYRCHAALQIPTNPQFGSLNLAAAVQLLAYDLRQALGGFEPSAQPQKSSASTFPTADAQSLGAMLTHWQEALEHIGFLDPKVPKKLMPRLNQILNRAALSTQEVNLLRGIAKAVLVNRQNRPKN